MDHLSAQRPLHQQLRSSEIRKPQTPSDWVHHLTLTKRINDNFWHTKTFSCSRLFGPKHSDSTFISGFTQSGPGSTCTYISCGMRRRRRGELEFRQAEEETFNPNTRLLSSSVNAPVRFVYCTRVRSVRLRARARQLLSFLMNEWSEHEIES